jgi:hypothetical protein
MGSDCDYIPRIAEILEIDPSDSVHVCAAGCAHEDGKKGEGKKQKNLAVIWPECIIAEIQKTQRRL